MAPYLMFGSVRGTYDDSVSVDPLWYKPMTDENFCREWRDGCFFRLLADHSCDAVGNEADSIVGEVKTRKPTLGRKYNPERQEDCGNYQDDRDPSH